MQKLFLSFRFQIQLRKCLVEWAKGRCGTVAAEILRRLLLYRYEYDFMCSLVEEKTEAISSPAVPSVTTDSSENTNKPLEKANNRWESFHSRENAKRAKYPEERVLETFSNEIDDLSLDFVSKNKAEKILDMNANFKTGASSNVGGISNDAEMEYFSEANGASFENEAKSTTSNLGFCFLQKPTESLDSQQTNCYSASSGTDTFGLYEIWVDCVKYLGCGKFLQKNTGDTVDLAANHKTLRIYLYENERYAEIATMKVNYFKPNKNSLPASTCVDSNGWSKHTNFQRVARRVGSFDSTKNSNEHLDAVSGQKKERVVATDSESLRDLRYYLQQSAEERAYEQFEESVTDFSTELSTEEMSTIDLLRGYMLGLAPSCHPPSRFLYQPYKLFRSHGKTPSDTEIKTLRPGLEHYGLRQLDSDRGSHKNKNFKLNDEKFSALHNGYCSKTPCPTTEIPDKFDTRPGKFIDFAHITKVKKLRERYVLERLGSDQDGDEGEIFKSKDETFSHAHSGYCSKERPFSTSSPNKFDIKPGMLINFAHIKEKERDLYEDCTPSLHTSKVKYTFKKKTDPPL
ncbi:hypothetical protein TNCT_384391 [Trichonephila clavata]|uniref:Uncharacterized protein n=1 Tax=Trichonephila clavata TaxID=2740835 RepID=A0A8X6H1Z2_TRICU|nr:hypothetical protein TNCT_384391 [Trichonephila clavata]